MIHHPAFTPRRCRAHWGSAFRGGLSRSYTADDIKDIELYDTATEYALLNPDPASPIAAIHARAAADPQNFGPSFDEAAQLLNALVTEYRALNPDTTK